MSNLQSSEFYPEFENFSTNEINLKPEHIEAALEMVSNIKEYEQQWQTYIHALGFFAFQEWLTERVPELFVDKTNCSIFQTEYADLIPAVSNIIVGNFKVCLIVTNLFEEVNIPDYVINLPEFTAHFYVAVEVEEESNLAAVRGFITYNELKKMKKELQKKSNNIYQVPVKLFDSKIDKLLLNFRCLEPTAIPLPKPSVNISGMSKEKANNYLSDLLQLVTAKAINVRYWLQNQTDVVADSLSWNLLSPVSPARRKTPRKDRERLEKILSQINHGNRMDIPPNIGCGYKNFNFGENEFYLYAVTWLISEVEKEWSLLLILISAEGEKSPSGIRLRISDRTGIIIEKEQHQNKENTYPYACVGGDLDERFVVTIVEPKNQEKISFVFRWDDE